MRCPFCGKPDTNVRDSRPAEDGASIRRRRVCGGCGGRFTTFERVQLREMIVVKRSGRRAPFDRDKLMRSVMLSLRKRPVAQDRIEQMISGIVRRLEASGESEVETALIGELVIEALRQIDAVAYVRYASVYWEFKDETDFNKFLGGAKAGARPPRERDPGLFDNEELDEA